MNRIPPERLAFFWSVIKQSNTFRHFLVNGMPFDLAEIEQTQGNERWVILHKKAVQYLIDKEELPTDAKPQNYEQQNPAWIKTFSEFQKIADEMSDTPADADEKPQEMHRDAFDRVVLPAGFREQILEVISQIEHNKKIFEEWGLGKVMKRGRGINMLFTGEPGTGKTHCAEIITEYLGAKCEIVTAASIESKWVGESEKNVAALFANLRGTKQVLVIDEADSFLTSRQDLQQHHEGKLTNQILVELERHRGIVILTTNRPVRLDRALSRRIDLTLNFPFPTPVAREQIWKQMVPEEVPKDEINWAQLAQAKLTGGQIRKVALAAIRALAGNPEGRLTTEILALQTVREQEMESMIRNGEDLT